MSLEDGMVILVAVTVAIVAICFSIVGYAFIEERRGRRRLRQNSRVKRQDWQQGTVF